MNYTPYTYKDLPRDAKVHIKLTNVVEMMTEENGDHPNAFEILEFVWNECDDTLSIDMGDIQKFLNYPPL